MGIVRFVNNYDLQRLEPSGFKTPNFKLGGDTVSERMG